MISKDRNGIKISLVANSGWYLYNFRLPLIDPLRECGVEIVFISPRDSYVERIEKAGFRWIELELDRRSINPFKEICTIYRLSKIYLNEKPHITHHFTIKCVLYGTIAAKISGVAKVVNSITGLGHLFVGNKWTIKMLRSLILPLYRQILKARRGWVIFQNHDNLEAFLNLDLVESSKVSLIKGSGVDTKKFFPVLDSPNSSDDGAVLFAARLLKDKGIVDFIEAARILKKKKIPASFLIAGGIDKGNPSSISESMLECWQQELPIKVLGHVDNIETIIKISTIVVLPSYNGEGVPKILLEAAAMGKPIVTTDVPGCRDVVEHNKNGLLVSVNNPSQLADAIEKLLQDEALRKKMGVYSREKAVREFDAKNVARRTIDVYEKSGLKFTTTQ